MIASVVVALGLALTFPDPARSTEAMAATAHPLATAAALEILEDGGNAIDAAIAATFAISVVSPFDAGLGGGGFAVVYLAAVGDKPSDTKALDFREVAPLAATRDMYIDKATGKVIPSSSMDGHLSVAVPGTVAGLAELHAKHGSLPWRRLLKPAIDIARDGFAVGDDFVYSFMDRKDVMSKYAATRAIFMKRDAKSGEFIPLERGDRLRQRDLAKTLKDIARDPRSFYEGRIAQAISADMKTNGGLVTLTDLKEYAPRWRDPLCDVYKQVRLCTMPPPSSGGVHVLQMLHLLENDPPLPWHHVDSLHRLIESMRIAFADRAVHLGDPAFTRVPVAELTSRAYADVRRKEIDPNKARKSSDVKAASPEVLAQVAAAMAANSKAESKDTSHLTVVDKQRNAVALTFTINYSFGSGVVAPGTGFLLNDEMDDFSAAPGVPNAYGLLGGEANSVQPKKIPLSSMTPLIGTKDGRFFMTAGAPGGSTIITTTLQTVLHVIDYGMNAQAAIAAPRLHHQWMPDTTRIEKFGMDDATVKALEARGHVFKIADHGWGNAMCIVERDGVLEGGADPRGEGEARGL